MTLSRSQRPSRTSRKHRKFLFDDDEVGDVSVGLLRYLIWFDAVQKNLVFNSFQSFRFLICVFVIGEGKTQQLQQIQHVYLE